MTNAQRFAGHFAVYLIGVAAGLTTFLIHEALIVPWTMAGALVSAALSSNKDWNV